MTMFSSPDVLTDTPVVNVPNEAVALPYAERTGIVEIESRFGAVALDYTKPLLFAKGILGMPENQRYCLIPYPSKRFAHFRLLHCLDDDTLGFITLPFAQHNLIIAHADLMEAMNAVNMIPEYTSLLLVVNVYREMNSVRMSVNARAPILIDQRTRHAEQYVLRNNAYLVRHMLRDDFTTINIDGTQTT
ncbi:MAG: hypothetical protein EAY76_05995 [Alphaproteobacteria bacterium]|nr:MAG: hypothetical protein EAY76_05995 [Alphaproteobacteria bacterium]TAF77160.1 MAG: hypothetical protein EAZ52_01090 [Alphaproteobacteria bacterium]